jgi:hypothetical protein
MGYRSLRPGMPLPAGYERDDHQARALLVMRILANSVSDRAAGSAAAGQIGGQGRHPRDRQRARRVPLGGDLSRTVGVTGQGETARGGLVISFRDRGGIALESFCRRSPADAA